MSPDLAGLPLQAPPDFAEVARWHIEPTVTAARVLRHDVMARWGNDEHDESRPLTMNRLTLVLTELVTNAVQHGEGLIDVALGRTSAGWLIVVSEAPSLQQRPAPAPTAWRRADLDAPETGGRGLSIVVAVSSRCGWTRRAGELSVWAEVLVVSTPVVGLASVP